ncbi:MAG: alpha/beta hydrolase [Bacteroidetes bacterium]|nr:alpha/beta hydrolase [Bacteroidota bacterium]
MAYHVFGQGSKILFCLHGYGDSGDSFYFLEKYLGKAYCIIAPDLPLHGSTKWDKKNAFLPSDLLQWIILICKKEGISLSNENKIHLLGYSMGGRLALSLFSASPNDFEMMALFCPDGLHENFWHFISTQTKAGNFLFQKTMFHPGWFFQLMEGAYQIKILNKSVYKFVHHYLDDPQARDLLYKRWTLFRKFKPSIPLVKKLVLKNKIPLTLVFGNYDRIILSSRSTYLKKNNPQVKVLILNAGHQIMREKYWPEIARAFYQ